MKVRSLALLAASLAACGSSSNSSPADAAGNAADAAAPRPDADITADARPLNCTPVAGTDIGLQEVATGLSAPIVIAQPAGETRFFVAEKGGKIKIIENGTARTALFLDLSKKVSKGSEQGLLGLAF